jgi:hypothetical protein
VVEPADAQAVLAHRDAWLQEDEEFRKAIAGLEHLRDVTRWAAASTSAHRDQRDHRDRSGRGDAERRSPPGARAASSAHRPPRAPTRRDE